VVSLAPREFPAPFAVDIASAILMSSWFFIDAIKLLCDMVMEFGIFQ